MILQYLIPTFSFWFFPSLTQCLSVKKKHQGKWISNSPSNQTTLCCLIYLNPTPDLDGLEFRIDLNWIKPSPVMPPSSQLQVSLHKTVKVEWREAWWWSLKLDSLPLIIDYSPWSSTSPLILSHQYRHAPMQIHIIITTIIIHCFSQLRMGLV